MQPTKFYVAEGKDNACRTLTSKLDNFETTRYMGPHEQEVARKTVKLCHVMAGLAFRQCQS